MADRIERNQDLGEQDLVFRPAAEVLIERTRQFVLCPRDGAFEAFQVFAAEAGLRVGVTSKSGALLSERGFKFARRWYAHGDPVYRRELTWRLLDLQQIATADGEFIASVDAALAESAQKCGAWLACRPGCTSCCMGSFEITQLDAERLRRGLLALESEDEGRAARIRERAARFGGEEDPCPVLDPITGLCELYESRPMTCRVFGPPVRCGDGGIGVCELCFEGATPDQIAACEAKVDPRGTEGLLLAQIEAVTGRRGTTTVAGAIG